MIARPATASRYLTQRIGFIVLILAALLVVLPILLV